MIVIFLKFTIHNKLPQCAITDKQMQLLAYFGLIIRAQ